MNAQAQTRPATFGGAAGWLGMARRMVTSVATRGRIAAIAAVAALGIVVGIIIDRSESATDFNAAEFLNGFGLVIFVPLVALVVASATLGTLREERTLAYFWLRPIGRWQIITAAIGAALVIIVPLALISLTILGVIVGDGAYVRGLLAGSVVGILGYTAIFTVLGLAAKRALAWGLVYIVVWEGFIAGLSTTAGRMSVGSYAKAMMSRVSDVPNLVDNPVSAVTAVIVAAALMVAAVLAGSWWLDHMDVD